MVTLTDNAINELKHLRSKWQSFIRWRYLGKFGTEQGNGFLTVLEREQMVEDLLDIYKYQTEKVKTQN